jgi:hypothetical protein
MWLKRKNEEKPNRQPKKVYIIRRAVNNVVNTYTRGTLNKEDYFTMYKNSKDAIVPSNEGCTVYEYRLVRSIGKVKIRLEKD